MSRLASRIVLTILLFPALIVCAVFTGGIASTLDRYFSETLLMMTVAVFNAVAFAVAFWAIWRSLIAWTPKRTSRFWSWSGGCATLAVLGVAAVHTAMDRWDAYPWSICCIAGVTVVWASGCARLWQESPKERAARIAAAGVNTALCPVCKYDLSGLINLKCPECGNQFTLGRLQDEQRRRLTPPGLD